MRIQYPTKWQWVWLCVNCISYADEEDDALKSNLEAVITDAEEKAKNAQQQTFLIVACIIDCLSLADNIAIVAVFILH